MTEDIKWKIIRFFGIPPEVVKWELDWIDENGNKNYHPHTGDMSMIEDAPDNDWKPLCFDENAGGDSEYCPGVHETNWMGYIQPELEENCRKCIYRKKEE